MDDLQQDERRVLDAMARGPLTDAQVDAVRAMLGPSEPLSDEEVDEILERVGPR